MIINTNIHDEAIFCLSWMFYKGKMDCRPHQCTCINQCTIEKCVNFTHLTFQNHPHQSR